MTAGTNHGADPLDGAPNDEARLLRLAQFSTDRAVDAVFWIGPTARILYVNDAACRVLGYPREDLVGRTVHDIDPHFPPEAWPAHWDELRRRGSFSFESDHCTRDGRLLKTEVTVNYIQHEGHEYNCAIMRDITARKEAEQQLRRKEAELWRNSEMIRAIIDGTNDAVYVKDPAGRYLLINRAGALILGHEPDAILGSDDTAFLSPEDVTQVQAGDRAVLESGATRTYDEVITTAGGRLRTFHSTKGPLRNEDGDIVGLFGISRDITDARQAEARVRQSEARLQALLRHSSDITSILDADGIIRYQSPAFYRHLGWSEADVLGRNAFDFVHPDDRAAVMAAFATALGDPEAAPRVVFRFRRSDDSYVTLESTGTARLDDPDIGGVVVNSRDITERLRLEEQLRHAQKMEAIGRLAGGIAHDFNNLLTVICGNSDALLRRCQLEPDHREAVDEIHRAGSRAAQLTRQMLAFVRRRSFEPQIEDVNAAVTGLTGMLRRVIGEHIRLDVRPDEAPGPVRIDRGELEQIIMNLAINARDAMPGGGTLTVETRTSDPAVVALVVRDTGCGMDASTIARIFEPFFTTKGPGQGTGLGLATVYGIATHCGGAVHVDSDPGRGTTLTINFPRAQRPTTAAPDAVAPHAPAGAETILLVEDEELVRNVARRALRQLGYTVFEASSGEEALARFGDDVRIQLMLTDLVMPGINGYILAERMTARRPALKVQFMSGYADVELSEGSRWRHEPFLRKPFTAEELGRMVRRTLDPPAARHAPPQT